MAEKAQWTTKQVVAFVSALSLALGFGGKSAIDSVYATESKLIIAPSRQDTLIAEISQNVTDMRDELRNYRQANKKDHEDLREDLKALNTRIRVFEKESFTKSREFERIYAKKGE